MSCVSEGGIPKRVRRKTEKGAKYSLEILYVESNRIDKRLIKQINLVQDLLQSDNVGMVDREVTNLDNIHNQLLETYAQIRECIGEMKSSSSEEEERLQTLVDVVDKEDAAVFEIKKLVSTWLMSQREEEEHVGDRAGRSRSPRNSPRSASPQLHRSGRTGSVRSFGSRRSGSNESIRSGKSDGS